MNKLKEAYAQELAQARDAGYDDVLVKHHLGRAHVLSQRSVMLHLYTHVLMLKYAIAQGDFREVLGQLLRLVVTAPGHMIGKVPVGNIGWATVSLTQPMPVPADIQEVLKD